MSCKLASSFAAFNVNFGASIFRGTLHSMSLSLRCKFACYIFWHTVETETVAHSSQLICEVHQMKI